MIIDSKIDNIICADVLQLEKGKPGKNIGKVILVPGKNQVPDNFWNIVKKYRNIKYYLDNEQIVEVMAKKETKEGKIEKIPATTITDLSNEEAEKVIKDCYDRKTLTDWKKIEQRPDIRNIIGDKIKELTTDKKDLSLSNKS